MKSTDSCVLNHYYYHSAHFIHSGKIHLECGLVHSCLCQYDDALQCFKQALPLVRAAGNGSGSQLLEASLLQNIGATYNEKLMYSESLVYHREAAAIHGKIAYIHSGFEGYYEGRNNDLHVSI